MKWLIPIILVSIITSSCGSGKTDNTQNIPGDTVKKVSNEEFMALYYLNDDKYAIDDPVINLDEWINQKIEFITLYGDSNSLFQRKGGGPAGSEWNPSNDFLLLTRVNNGSDQIKDISMEINGITIDIDLTTFNRHENYDIIYGIVPFNIWDSHLINNRETPIPDPELEIPPDIDIYYLKFTLQISFESRKATSFNEYFLSAYGE